MRTNALLRASLAIPPALALLALGATPLVAQNTTMAGLQGDPSMLTPGGWIYPAAPPGNPQPNPPTAYLKNRIALGKALFWDEQVSTSNTMACGTCHIPEAGGVDIRKPGTTVDTFGHTVFGSFGTVPQDFVGGIPGSPIDYGFVAPPSFQETRGVTPIQVPTMIGAYMFHQVFWDERAGPMFKLLSGVTLFPDWAALEDQSVNPPFSKVEMGHQNLAWGLGTIEKKLGKEAPLALVVPGSVPPSIPAAWLSTPYAKIFDAVFAASTIPSIAAPAGVTRERFAMAIAAYERTLVPDQAPIDTNSMTTQELLGFDVFAGNGCVRCHSLTGAPVLANRIFPVIGTLTNPWDNVFSDGQKHDIFPANPARSIGKIKAPTLRNVGLRKRYFHDGMGRIVAGVPKNTLPDIVDFYDIDQDPIHGGPGGGLELHSLTGAPDLTPAERAALIAFLGNALTDPRVASATFPFDRPKLYSEAVPFNSNHTHPATAAPAGWKPLTIADVPPLVEKIGGPSWWKVGVGSNGAGAGLAPIIPPGSKAVLFLGTNDLGPGPFYVGGVFFAGSYPTTAQGFATAHTPIALATSMIGVTAYLQWMVIDSSGFVGYSESARFTPL